MDLAKLHWKLIRAARTNPPSDRVPYAFEQRILSLLEAHPVADGWALWARALWFAVAPCVAIMLLFAAWSLFAPETKAPAGDLSQQFESTLLAAVDQDQTADSTW